MKKINLYEPGGYLDMKTVIESEYAFTFIVAARGTGKTYGALKYCVDNRKKFIYMRRTQMQADMLRIKEYMPFKTLNSDMGWSINPFAISKSSSAFFDSELDEESGKLKPTGEPYGYTCALSTIANMRGFDGSDIEIFLYDEFIKEKQEQLIKGELMALFNAYETINRNRELYGRKPLKLVGMANSNDLANPILSGLKLTRRAERMVKRGIEISVFPERSLALIIPCKSKISEKKKETVLYKLSEGTDFYKMAVENNFLIDKDAKIGSLPLKGMIPVAVLEGVCVYKSKTEGITYLSSHVSGSPEEYKLTQSDIMRARRDLLWVWIEQVNHRVICEDYECYSILTKFFL